MTPCRQRWSNLPRALVRAAGVGGLLLAVAAAAVVAAAAEPAMSPVSVPSLDRGAGAVALRMPGFWSPATATGPAPAIVLLHGCGGVYDRQGHPAARYREMAARLNRLGIHALVADSLTPRGERELCTQRIGSRQVTMQQRRRDVLGALQWLAAQPGVDPARIGVLGWSNGGSSVLAATNLRHPEVARASVRPALAVAYYPGCATESERGYEAVAPLLLLVGAADDWTPAAPCEALARSATGRAVEIEVYAGAYHGFDGTAPLRHRADVPGGVRPGEGVHVGADPAARAASAQRLERFLRERWGSR